MKSKRMLAAGMLVAVGTLGLGGIAAGRVDGSAGSSLAADAASRCAAALSRLSANLEAQTNHIADLEGQDAQTPGEGQILANKLARANAKLARIQARYDRVSQRCGK